MTSSSPHTTGAIQSDLLKLADQLEADLVDLHGPLMGGSALHRALGYRTAVAFRRALHQSQIPIKVFGIDFRRGKFALTKDVAAWLAQVASAKQQSPSNGRKE